MFKNALVLILMVLVFQKVSAQRGKDTLAYLMTNSGQLAKTKDSADYAMFILPNDPKDKKSLYPVIEYYPNGKRKLAGMTHIPFYILNLEGACMTFFPDGHRQSIKNYENGILVGDEIQYYPNGQLYAIKKHIKSTNRKVYENTLLLFECHDSTGMVLAENGNGQWLRFNDNLKNMHEVGPIKDGLEDGLWKMEIDDKIFNFTYNKGIITSPSNYNFSDKIFDTPDVEATFKGGIYMFYEFLVHTLRYPAQDRENNVTGKVFISFVVEKDGSLTNFEIIRTPSHSLAAEALRSMKLSPAWIPGSIGGAPVRAKYTVPLNFTLSSDN